MTKEDVQNKFDTDVRWLLKGVLAIHNQQTLDEKQSESTNHNNHRGFTSSDAKFLTSIANQIRKGYGLSPKQTAVTRRKMRKYASQCLALAKKGVKPESIGRFEEAVEWTAKKAEAPVRS
jgi:hypothetical protein